MPIKTIPTVYFPTSKSAPKAQYWLPVLKFDVFSPTSHRTESVTSRARQWLDALHDILLHNSLLQFIPVTNAVIPDDYNRTVFCGFIPSPQSQPINPLIIRGQALPEIFATSQWFPHEKKWHVTFSSSNYGANTLSAAQKKKLSGWFEDQLVFATTESLLEGVKARSLQDAQQSLREFIQRQRQYCKELEDLTEQN